MSDEDEIIDNEEVLTEEESDALLDQSQSAAEDGGVQDPGADFWEQIAPDRIPALEAVNEECAEALGRLWEQLFKRRREFNPEPGRFARGRDVLRLISLEGCVRSFDIPERQHKALLIAQADTVSSMVDICFGGAGAGRRSERLAELTEMERRMFARFADGARDAVSAVWNGRAGISLRDSAEEFDTGEHPHCEFGARVAICRFTFDIAETEHELSFIWPAPLVESLRQKPVESLPGAGRNSQQDWSHSLRADIEGAQVELRAVIGGIRIRLHEISKAEIGDIIMTEPLERVQLLAAGKPVFEGRLGNHNGLNAVKIARPCVQKGHGDAR